MTDNQQDMLPASSIAAIQKAGANQNTPALHDQRPHSQRLREAMFNGAVASAAKYKQDHPGARDLRTHIDTLAYKPKPAGYKAALVDRVSQWFDNSGALAATNRTDVDRLNAQLQTDMFNPDNHFSKPLSPSIRKELAALLHKRGAVLPETAKTMSDVRKAVRSYKASNQPQAEPFGHAGWRSANALTIGGRSYRIEVHNGQECIRVTAGGKTQRVNLTTVKVLIGDLVERGPGSISNIPITSYIGELVPRPKNTDLPASSPIAGTSSPGEYPDTSVEVNTPPDNITGICDQKPAEPEKLGITERIAALRRVMPPVADTQHPPDDDPLCHL
ncbi:hypothetical protein [Sphingorhabdus sp. EL138]|uniref:hypothetical protein n=1 Tax=Sphingorhabdus sp. EL138 TaxID=2073156 RepID=UPI000D6899AD|nr:hypothetical protein [Sphingorhabdus sp. EL138]